MWNEMCSIVGDFREAWVILGTHFSKSSRLRTDFSGNFCVFPDSPLSRNRNPRIGHYASSTQCISCTHFILIFLFSLHFPLPSLSFIRPFKLCLLSNATHNIYCVIQYFVQTLHFLFERQFSWKYYLSAKLYFKFCRKHPFYANYQGHQICLTD